MYGNIVIERGENMRFNVELLLENEIIPKDKNRIILSLMKHNFNSYDKDYFIELYKQIPNKKKTFTFALYMGNCKFLREEIVITEKKIILNFSFYKISHSLFCLNKII